MLREYQEKIIDRMMWAMSMPGNDVICGAVGMGKTHIIAEFANRLGKPILIFAPNQELIQQDYDKLVGVVGKENVGIFSASKHSKEVNKFTIASIQSAKNHPELFGHYDVVIIDECEAYSPKNTQGMYNKFFKYIQPKKVFGLTGTPYRLDVRYERWGQLKWQVESKTITKMINRYGGFFWKRMLAVVNPDTLIEHGFLCPLEYHDVSLFEASKIPSNKSKSEYDLEKFNKMIEDKYQNIASVIEDLPHKLKLVFCTDITQADTLHQYVDDSAVVTSETPRKEREKIVDDFKAGRITTLFNVNIFTAGFDVPSLDCLVCLRPTRSLRLWVQMMGRVCRNSEGKEIGHVYDLVSNIKSLGRLESIKVIHLETGWDVVSDARPSGFHQVELFSHRLKQPKLNRENENA